MITIDTYTGSDDHIADIVGYDGPDGLFAIRAKEAGIRAAIDAVSGLKLIEHSDLATVLDALSDLLKEGEAR